MRLAAVWAAAALAVAIAPQPVFAAAKPDLTVAEISTASATVAAGSELSIEDTVENIGRVAAGPSTTRFYLSSDRARGGGDTRLKGRRRVGRLGAGRTSSGPSGLDVPLRTPQEDLFLIGCADDRKEVPEKRENNNCRASEATISIELPEDCTDRLTALGVSFEAGPNSQGVADPVTVETPIRGITYSTLASGNVNDLYMDCTLALALHDMAGEMSARGLVHVEHAGIYNYRCIGGGTPPDCPNGLTQHAYATAIDILELRSAGETYNVNDDWVIDSAPTCSAATDGPENALLHEFACALHAAGTFHIVLTPNYNADHRNHFHLDLTPDFSYID